MDCSKHCQNLIGRRLNVAAVLGATTHEPTGFVDPEDVIINYDKVTRKITLTGTIKAYYRMIQRKELFSGYISPAHPDVTGSYFLVYDGNSISWKDPSLLEFFDLLIAFAIYTPTIRFAIRECHGFMPWQSHRENHYLLGTYREPESGGIIGDYALNSTTVADRRPSVTQAEIRDEDLPTILAALAAGGPYTEAHLSGVDTAVFDTTALDIVPLSGNQPFWNEFTGGAWQQTLMSNNSYMSIWLLAIPSTKDGESQKYRFDWIQGQSESLTLSGEEAKTTLDISLGPFAALSPESVFIGRVIIRFQGGNWTYTKVESITGSRVSQIQGAAPVVINEFTADLFRILDPADPTKEAAFDASKIDSATTRTFKFPNKSGTISLEEIEVADNPDTSKTLGASDVGRAVEYTNAGAGTVTFPLFAAGTIKVGDYGQLWAKDGSGSSTIVKGGTMLFRGEFGDVSIKLSGKDGKPVFWVCTDEDEYMFSGFIEAA